MNLDKARRKILFATLPHVPFDGWSRTALAAGTGDAGVEPVMRERAFPGGPGHGSLSGIWVEGLTATPEEAKKAGVGLLPNAE